MPDLCPLCMSPIVEEPAITEDPVLYDALVEELGLDPKKSLEPETRPPIESQARGESG